MTGTTSPYFIEGILLQTPRIKGMLDLKNMFVSCDIFEEIHIFLLKKSSSD